MITLKDLKWKRRKRKIERLLGMDDGRLGRKAKRRMKILDWMWSHVVITDVIAFLSALIVFACTTIMEFFTDSTVGGILFSISFFIIVLLPASWFIIDGTCLFWLIPKPLDCLARTLGKRGDASISEMASDISVPSEIESSGMLDHPECWTDEEYGEAIRAMLCLADLRAMTRGELTDDMLKKYNSSAIVRKYCSLFKRPMERLKIEKLARKKRIDDMEREEKERKNDDVVSMINRLSAMFDDVGDEKPDWVDQTPEIRRLIDLNGKLGGDVTKINEVLSSVHEEA